MWHLLNILHDHQGILQKLTFKNAKEIIESIFRKWLLWFEAISYHAKSCLISETAKLR